MHKIWVILKREYLTRVQNKTFIIMTFLGPILIGLFYGAIFMVAMKDAGDKSIKNVLYTDNSGFYKNKLDSFDNFHFYAAPSSRDEALKKVQSGEFYSLCEINDRDLSSIDSIQWISKKTLSLLQVEKLSGWISGKVYLSRLQAMGLSKNTVDSLKPKTTINSVEIDNEGAMKNSSSGLKSGIGFFLAFVVYMFIFIYGAMVMRSALEEKTNRIVEVVVSSIKPFQMMMGKILGVALVGLTQFAAWVILSLGLITVISGAIGSKMMEKGTEISAAVPGGLKSTKSLPLEQNLLDTIGNLPILQILVVFLIFFIGGFLLYSSMFAAIGSAVNQETDVQQFMLPISLPLVFGFVIAQSSVFQDPNGPMATVFSYIPFTSPILMVVRSPFGVSWTEIFISAVILFATFLFMVWITSRIYRIGILMYGKKPTWKELGKWIFRKD